MRGVLWLSWRAVCARPLISALLVLCVGVSIALPLTTTVLLERFEASLRARAASTPLIVGPDVSRFDLVFAGLYFREADIASVPRALASDARRPGLTVIPLRLDTTARTHPVVGTDDAYYAHRNLSTRAGELPFLLGEAALGAGVARQTGLGVGDTLVTDPPDGLNLAASSPIELTIVGVLAPTGTPDDGAVFTTLPTAWLAEGVLHGHTDARSVEGEENVIGSTERHVALSGAVPTARRVDDENRASFHYHADPDGLPLTALIVVPESDKDETIALARLDALEGVRALRSREVVDELLLTVLRIKSALDTVSALFIATTGALLVLIFWLTARLRADETRTIRDIGAARGTAVLLFICEGAYILFAGLVTGAALAWSTVAIAQRMLVWV
ncbi:MAG: ABC transporter permease [Phycisphaerales bacterium]